MSKPDYIDRYQYPDNIRPTYMEPPGFITGADRYVPITETPFMDPTLQENERLRALLKECADDLEAMVEAQYPPEARKYPSEARRYERDIGPVRRAREALQTQEH